MSDGQFLVPLHLNRVKRVIAIYSDMIPSSTRLSATAQSCVSSKILHKRMVFFVDKIGNYYHLTGACRDLTMIFVIEGICGNKDFNSLLKMHGS